MNKSYWVKGVVFVFFVFMQMNTGFLSAQTSKNSLYKQTSEMADMMIQYDADKGSVTRFYASSSSQENRFSRPDAGVGYVVTATSLGIVWAYLVRFCAVALQSLQSIDDQQQHE